MILDRKLWLSGLVWLVTLVAAFSVGLRLGRARPGLPAAAAQLTADRSPSLAQVRTHAPEATVSAARVAPPPRELPAAAWGSSTSSPPDEQAVQAGTPTTDPRAILNDSDPLRRMIGFTGLLQALTPETVSALLAAFEELPRDQWQARSQEFQLLLRAWAKVDPEAALAYARESRYGNRAHTVLETWGASDPRAAVEWVDANSEGIMGHHYLGAVMRGAATTDLDFATELLLSIDEDDQNAWRHGVQAITTAYLAKGTDNAMKWAESLPDGPRKAAVVTAVANGVAREDALRAAAWLETLGGSAYSDAMAQVASMMDPQAGLEWVMQHGDDEARRRALPRIVSRWPADDIDAIARWLGDYPESADKDRLLEVCAYRLQHKDPRQALEWAARIGEQDRRNRTSQALTRLWRRRDPEAAAAALGPE